MKQVQIDLLTRSESGDTYRLILVEQGPWAPNDIAAHVGRLHARLNDVAAAVTEGAVAERFPEIKGKSIVIRLDGYDVPRDIVENICARFVKSLENSGLTLETSFMSLPANAPGATEPPRPWWKRLWS